MITVTDHRFFVYFFLLIQTGAESGRRYIGQRYYTRGGTRQTFVCIIQGRLGS